MNNIKIIGTSIVVSVLAVLIGFGIHHPSSVNTSTTNVVKGTSPEITSPYLSVNGVTEWYASMNMNVATTSLCAFQAPLGTSTLQYVSWNILQGTSTAATIDIASSTTAYSTSTNLVSATSVSSNSGGNAVWMPTYSVSPNFQMISTLASPQWIVVKTAGAGLAGYTYGGRCQAEFTQL